MTAKEALDFLRAHPFPHDGFPTSPGDKPS